MLSLQDKDCRETQPGIQNSLKHSGAKIASATHCIAHADSDMGGLHLMCLPSFHGHIHGRWLHLWQMTALMADAASDAKEARS